MNRYGGEGDVHRRRRTVAIIAGLVVLVLLFALLVGC
jgi:hypothetical protein